MLVGATNCRGIQLMRLLANFAVAVMAWIVALGPLALSAGASTPFEVEDRPGVSGLVPTKRLSALTKRHGPEPEEMEVSLVPSDLIVGYGQSSVAVEVSGSANSTVEVRVEGEGGAEMMGSRSFEIETDGQGLGTASVSFSAGEGEAKINFAFVDDASADETPFWEDSVYVVGSHGELMVGVTGFTPLRVAAFDRHEATALSPSEVADARRAVLDEPGVPFIRPAQAEARSALAVQALADPGEGQVGLQGFVCWTNEDGVQLPWRKGFVQIWEAELGPDAQLATVATDDEGRYSVTLDNNDGLGSGGRDLYVRAITEGDKVEVASDGLVGIADPYQIRSLEQDDVEDAVDGVVYDISFCGGNSAEGTQAMGVHQAAILAFDYSESLGYPLKNLDVEFYSDDETTFFTDPILGSARIVYQEQFRFEWDIFHHEFGHFFTSELNLDDSPGGAHGIAENLADRIGKDEGLRLAWGEGLATFWAVAMQVEMEASNLGVPRVGDLIWEAPSVGFAEDLEVGGGAGAGGLGEDNESAISRALWDLYDAESDVRDPVVSTSDARMWELLVDAKTMSDAWQAIVGDMGEAERLRAGCIAANWGLGPSNTTPAIGTRLDPAIIQTFSWDAGGSPSFPHDNFVVEITGEGIDIRIPTTGTSAAPSQAQWDQLIDAGPLTWAVVGTQSADPATGPYRSCEYAFRVSDQPGTAPTASAGGPYSVGPNGVLVVTASGSTDPNGGLLTYAWDLNADGLFDDAVGPNPSIQFDTPGTYVISVQVTNLEGLTAVASTEVTVGAQNSAPAVAIVNSSPVDENQAVAVSGSLSDADGAGSLAGTVDWDDGAIDPVVGQINQDGELVFSLDHVYGDNGDFEVEVCATDGEATTCEATTVTVNNVIPSIAITSPEVQGFPGLGAAVVSAGDQVEFAADLSDPGSDDLTVKWNWDDGDPSPDVSTTYLNNPPDFDPRPSPEISPKSIVDAHVHTFDSACLYTVTTNVVDDDGGAADDAISVVVRGLDTQIRSAGYWFQQARQGPSAKIDLATLECYLAVVRHVSSVFDEERSLADAGDGRRILEGRAASGSTVTKLDRQLLAAWLNWASGSADADDQVDEDGDGIDDAVLLDVLVAAEAARLTSDSSPELVERYKDILDRFNNG